MYWFADGKGACWTSWGATTVEKETGHKLQFSGDLQGFVLRVFQIVLQSLGNAGRTPHEIEVLFRKGYLFESAFCIPRFLEPTVKPVLQNLKKLLLTTDVHPETGHMYAGDTHINTTAGHLRRLLLHTPNLTHLRLNLQRHHSDRNKSFLQWLSKPAPNVGTPSTTALEPPPVDLAYLKSLELGHFEADPETILNVIAKYRSTLQELSLWRLDLSDPNTTGDPRYALRDGPKPNLWAMLFKKLARMQQLRLTHLKTGMLKQDTVFVNWKVPAPDDAPLEKSRKYSGTNIEAFLTGLIDESVVQWPDRQVYVPANSDSDEEMDDNENDDMDDDDDDDDEDDDQ